MPDSYGWRFSTSFSRAEVYGQPTFPEEVLAVDVVFLLALGMIYGASHLLAWALTRLGETP